MEDLSAILQQLQIGKKEAAVYLAALDMGAASASAIAKRAGIQRTHFYDLADKLVAIGLLKQIVTGKKRLFIPTDPQQILETQEQRLEQLKKAIPELKALYSTSGQKPTVSYYDGPAGIRYMNEDTLRYKGEIVGFTTPRFTSGQRRGASSEYIRNRVAKGIRARLIGEASPEMQQLHERDSEELRETRLLSPDVFRSEIELGVYGNKVFVVDYKAQFGFIIEGSDIARTVKMIFEIVWKRW